MINRMRICLAACGLGLSLLNPTASAEPEREAVLSVTGNPDIRQGYIDNKHGQLHYWTSGAGPNLLLIHQSSSSTEEYAALAPFLADDFRLIAVDLPGHGGSDDPERELTMDEFTQSALDILDALGVGEAHVLGHHGGALIAMNLAWKHPERIDKLILSGTSGIKPMEAVAEFSDGLELEKKNLLKRDGQSLQEAWARYTGYLPDASAEEVLIPFLNNVTVRVRPYDAHFAILRWDRRPAAEALKDKEILLMQGERDVFVSDQETLLEVYPKAARVVVEDAGLFLFFEAPEAAAAPIRNFLTGGGDG